MCEVKREVRRLCGRAKLVFAMRKADVDNNRVYGQIGGRLLQKSEQEDIANACMCVRHPQAHKNENQTRLHAPVHIAGRSHSPSAARH